MELEARRSDPPGCDEVARYAEQLRLRLSGEEVEAYRDAVADHLATFDRLGEFPEPTVALRHTHRAPGGPPASGRQDPFRAIIRWCEVAGARTGPLAGMTLGIKDCIAVAGIPTTGGGHRLPCPVPTEDAVVVERVLEAGARIVAKTNMADMSMGLGAGSGFGAVRNPHDVRFSAGGSSSGSGAAVAGGLVDLALGADQGGSIRIPAAWCGIVGMKPTYGLVPAHGLTHLEHSLDHIGPMTTTVADNALLLETIAGGDWRDPHTDPDRSPGDYRGAAERGAEGLRIGVVTESVDPHRCTPATLEAFERAREVLAGAGAVLVPISIPLWSAGSVLVRVLTSFAMAARARSSGHTPGDLSRVDVHAEAAAAVHYHDGMRQLPFALRTRLLAVAHLQETYGGAHLGYARNLRLELRRQVERALADVDLLVTPTTPAGPVRLPDGDPTQADSRADVGVDASYNTCPFNLTGHPALTLPCGFGEHRLPAGLQIAGRRFDEHTVYRAGFAFEAAAELAPWLLDQEGEDGSLLEVSQPAETGWDPVVSPHPASRTSGR
ncbi:amidase family protein [Amycolatopsis acidiphila]|uniref:Amidase n=1 Tax=Amycolatopsis acidiphila TaxID=715473 RepID=A0A557ZXW5_9PSEU|nr:amidase family protein [Amycolatopsis acidiphila]TVT16840.1 amidase [Amycolatopsis acidiphila]GHG65817.1 amidase [Amycolatopsis acidiphila]